MWGAGLHSRLIDLYLAHTAWVPDSKNDSKIDPKVSQKLENIKANCQNNFPTVSWCWGRVTGHCTLVRAAPLMSPMSPGSGVATEERGLALTRKPRSSFGLWLCVGQPSDCMRGVGSSEHWSLCLESTKLKYYLATLTPRTLELVWRLQIIAGYLQNVSDNYRACYLWGAAWV